MIIDPFGVAASPSQAARFNPLSLFRGSPELIVDESRRLANALVVRPKDEREPFFNSGAQVVIQTVLAFLMSEAEPKEGTFNRLRDIVSNPNLMRELLEYMDRSDACDGLFRRMAGTVRWYQGETEASIYAVANTHLEFLDSTPIAVSLSETTFDLRRLLDGKMTIYLCLPVDRIQELRGLQRVMVTSLINYIFQAGESRQRRVRFYLDESVSLGEIDALYNAMVYGRSFGMRLMFFFQSMAQVSQCFQESRAADFQATVASVFTGINDYRTAQEVSQWIGQTTVQSHSFQSGDNWGQSWSHGVQERSTGGNSGGSSSVTYSQVGRALIQPEEVLQLPKSMAIALLPGIPPILFEKMPYYKKHVIQRNPWFRAVGSLVRLCLYPVAGAFMALLFRGMALNSLPLALHEADQWLAVLIQAWLKS